MAYILSFSVSDRVRENECGKLVRLKEGLVKMSEAYIEMSTKCSLLFTAQKVSRFTYAKI